MEQYREESLKLIIFSAKSLLTLQCSMLWKWVLVDFQDGRDPVLHCPGPSRGSTSRTGSSSEQSLGMFTHCVFVVSKILFIIDLDHTRLAWTKFYPNVKIGGDR